MNTTHARIRALAIATLDGVIIRGPDAPNEVLRWFVYQRLTDSHHEWTQYGQTQYGMVVLNERGRELAAQARESA